MHASQKSRRGHAFKSQIIQYSINTISFDLIFIKCQLTYVSNYICVLVNESTNDRFTNLNVDKFIHLQDIKIKHVKEEFLVNFQTRSNEAL